VHFGIILVVNMEIGLATPPVGLNLYVASSISKLGLTDVTKATFPWLVTGLIFLMMITFIPEITLWLPRMTGWL
ncbi:MAG: TRAP transporter large permease subunit, partial [Kerstersia gyiorum]|jgi:C4-dicarboxylate transporter DctM subunit